MKNLVLLFITLLSVNAFSQLDQYDDWSFQHDVDKIHYKFIVDIKNESFETVSTHDLFRLDTACFKFYIDSLDFGYANTIILGGTSGQYLRGDGVFTTFPTIPTNTNQLTNGAGFLTSFTEVDGSTTNELELPTQTGNNGKILSTNGSAASWVSLPAANYFTAYSAGTVYTLTTSSAKVDFGTTDPSITITTPGTYQISVNIRIQYNGLTTALNACNFKLRRTNNTAADLANASTNFNVPAVTLLSGTGGDCDMPSVIYTTANSNDVIELWANRSGGLTLGSIEVAEASIVAVRLF